MATLTQLQADLQKALEDIVNIEAQLEHGDQAKSKGQKWEINARTALKYKKLVRDRLVQDIAEERRQERVRNGQHFGRLFIMAAQAVLTREQFEQIIEKARGMQSIAASVDT